MTHPPGTCQGFFYFDPDDPIYEEHFPGHPVVPGSLIIHAFIEEAGSSAALADPWSIKDFRFKRFISPGRYAFRIKPRADGRRDCVLYDEDTVVVTGTI